MKGDHLVEKAEYWREHDHGQRQSGLSVRSYCQREGVKVYTFNYWRQKFRDQKPVKATSFIRVIEAKARLHEEVVARLRLGSEVVLECLAWPEAGWLRDLGRAS